jgi:Domain of unknown function (DUF1883)/TIR domain
MQMQFIQSDLGYRNRGDVLVVTLTNGANVRLLDSSNFQRYKQGQRHTFHGGLATQSPVRIPIPTNGHWYAVVDMQGLGDSTRAGFQVINGEALRPLPPIQQRRDDLARIAENIESVQRDDEANKDFDVFISHAAEDKNEIVRPLAVALQGNGLSVWFDEFELRIGDSLRRKIDAGIARSRFGVVILSKHFFAKSWSQYELDGLVTMSVSARQVLLPLWHNISKDEVLRESPSLADKVALRTADYSIEEIAGEIAAVVTGDRDA